MNTRNNITFSNMHIPNLNQILFNKIYENIKTCLVHSYCHIPAYHPKWHSDMYRSSADKYTFCWSPLSERYMYVYHLSVFDKGYSRKASCALNWILLHYNNYLVSILKKTERRTVVVVIVWWLNL